LAESLRIDVREVVDDIANAFVGRTPSATTATNAMAARR
jgi:hypothetical protein